MRKTLLFIMMLLTGLAASAQSSIQVKVQNLVSLDEQFNITFIIEGENAPSDFSWETGDDFQLVWGPQKGTSTSVSIINGKRSRSAQTTYTYVLMPRKTGSFTLPAASATVKGEPITSSRPHVEVVSNGGGQGGRQSQSSSGSEAASVGTVSGEDLFLRMIVGKTSIMVGETLPVTLKLYQRLNIGGFEDARFPSFNGFWSQETYAPTNIEFRRESVDDKIYNVAVLRSWNLVAQQAGDLKIDSAELVCLVNIRNRNSGTGSIFDAFFQDEYQTIRKRISTGPVSIKVSPLPAGAPDSFCGGVGKYSMTAVLTRDSLKAHDAASLKIAVTGTGNTSLLEAPKISFPPDFEVYDAKVSDIGGGKLFEIPFIPRSSGDFVIGPVKYSYFDISSRKYVTLESQPLSISVARGPEQASDAGSGTLVQGVSRRDVKDLGSDIRFISKAVPSLVPVGYFFMGSTAFWAVALALVLLAVLAFLVARARAASRADVAGSRNRAATKMARKRLSRAGAYLKDNLYTAFYEELHKTLLGFVSDKMNMDAADMSKENISARLVESGVAESMAAEFVALLDACEFARYAPDAGHDAMNAHYETAVNVISSIDGSMRRKTRTGAGAAAAALILMLAVPGNARAALVAAECDSLWNTAVSAYADGRWVEASEGWNAIFLQGFESSELHYNIGNAEFKAGNLAKAVVSYERALKLDPSNANARFNLEYAQMLVKDKIEVVPEFFLKSFMRRFCWIMSSNVWAVLGLVFLAIALVMLLMFLLASGSGARKAGFACAIVSAVLTVLCLSFAAWQKGDYSRADGAVVMQSVVSVKSSPGSSNAQDLFILHEGTVVKILDEVGEWLNIELSDGRQGWLRASEIEVI